MSMTRYGQAAQYYSYYVSARPFSRFTQDAAEIAANERWSADVEAWARLYLDEYGFLSQAGREQYWPKARA
ncbi:MAG TPA: hypothetical protein VFH39_03400 [Candidatus Saccharimonadales bacterium]|nr:hypothetical protein [Candidatus Saccharimonadales bacterium]